MPVSLLMMPGSRRNCQQAVHGMLGPVYARALGPIAGANLAFTDCRLVPAQQLHSTGKPQRAPAQRDRVITNCLAGAMHAAVVPMSELLADFVRHQSQQADQLMIKHQTDGSQKKPGVQHDVPKSARQSPCSRAAVSEAGWQAADKALSAWPAACSPVLGTTAQLLGPHHTL